MILADLASAVLEAAKSRDILLTTAESCTGGMVISALTDIAGSSAVVDRGFITYSNEAKSAMLGVSPQLITTHGAVSIEVVRAMAAGALEQIKSDKISHKGRLAVATSGIAGPGGGSRDKPVGLVWFGLAMEIEDRQILTAEKQIFDGDRKAVRQAATLHALRMMRDQLAAESSLG
ncbi:CinA family protein [Alphaproteobacteria bacterium LSUCC0684]